jgi:phosphoribosylformylglycinamidine synthase
MLLVLRDGAEAHARAVFAKWDLECVTVGRVTDSGAVVLRWHGDEVAHVPVAPIGHEAPVYQRPHVRRPAPVPIAARDVDSNLDPGAALKRLMGCPDLASRRWIWEQYDHTVMGDTVQRPGGDAAVVRIHGSGRGVALTTDCTPRYCAADPKQGGIQAVAEAWRNLCAVGARPLAITNCLNFGSPENPVVMGQLVDCIEGMAEACRALDFPVVSGNVSLYNETDGQAIRPTPTIGGLGLLADLDHMATIAYPSADLVLVLIGETFGWLGCSLYLREICGREEGAPPPVDLATERRNGELIRTLCARGLIEACHDLSDGGLLVALAEMALASGIGADLELPEGDEHDTAWLFGEDQGRYLVAVARGKLAETEAEAARAGVLARRVGNTGGAALTLDGGNAISLEELAAIHRSWLPALMGAA